MCPRDWLEFMGVYVVHEFNMHIYALLSPNKCGSLDRNYRFACTATFVHPDNNPLRMLLDHSPLEAGRQAGIQPKWFLLLRGSQQAAVCISLEIQCDCVNSESSVCDKLVCMTLLAIFPHFGFGKHPHFDRQQAAHNEMTFMGICIYYNDELNTEAFVDL